MFSAVHLRGSPLEPAGFAPSDALLDAMWRQWEAIITVPVLEVRQWCLGLCLLNACLCALMAWPIELGALG